MHVARSLPGYMLEPYLCTVKYTAYCKDWTNNNITWYCLINNKKHNYKFTLFEHNKLVAIIVWYFVWAIFSHTQNAVSSSNMFALCANNHTLNWTIHCLQLSYYYWIVMIEYELRAIKYELIKTSVYWALSHFITVQDSIFCSINRDLYENSCGPQPRLTYRCGLYVSIANLKNNLLKMRLIRKICSYNAANMKNNEAVWLMWDKEWIFIGINANT